MRGSKAADDVGRVVGRTVVHYDDLGGESLLMDVVQHLWERDGQPFALVVSRDYEAIGQVRHQQLRRAFIVCQSSDESMFGWIVLDPFSPQTFAVAARASGD